MKGLGKTEVTAAERTSARSLSAATHVPVETDAPGSTSPCNAAFSCGSLKSIGSNP
jgi:hypothetical protein